MPVWEYLPVNYSGKVQLSSLTTMKQQGHLNIFFISTNSALCGFASYNGIKMIPVILYLPLTII